MKIFITVLCSLILLCACNNTGSNNAEKSEVEIPQQEKDLKAAIEKNPDSLILKETLIQYYRDNKNYSEGVKTVSKFIETDTANARLWDIKAQMLFLNHDTINSIKAFEKAIEINPDPSYVIALGTIYAQTGNPSALEISDALLYAPTAEAQLYAVFIKGLYYNYRHEYAKAIPFFDNCIKIDYTFLDAYIEKTIALYELGNYEAAMQVAQKAIAVDHSFADGYYWMGRSCEKLNKKAEAAESYKAALNLDPDYVEAKDALGKLGVL